MIKNVTYTELEKLAESMYNINVLDNNETTSLNWSILPVFKRRMYLNMAQKGYDFFMKNNEIKAIIKNKDIDNSKSNRKKVLIIGGGGVFGMIPVVFLKHTGFDIKDIHAISGTSIGGIISLYLSEGKSADKLYENFKNEVPVIFETPSIWRKLNPFCSKYPADNVEKSLKRMLTSEMGELKIPTVVPSVNFKLSQPKIFESFDNFDEHIETWKVGRATSAAPTYFPPYSEDVLIDGGIIENLPILTTVTCLKNKLGWQYEDMDVFVLGTGFKDRDIRTNAEVSSYGAVSWLKNLLIPYVTKANEMASNFYAQQMNFHSYTYFNPVNISGSMDDYELVTSGSLENDCEPYLEIFNREWRSFVSGRRKITCQNKNKILLKSCI